MTEQHIETAPANGHDPSILEPEFPQLGSTTPIDLAPVSPSSGFRVRIIYPRIAMKWLRRIQEIEALNNKRREEQRKQFADVPGHPCHDAEYSPGESDDELSELCRTVLRAVLPDEVEAKLGPEEGVFKKEELIERLDLANLLAVAGTRATLAQVPSMRQKKVSSSS